MFSALYPLLSPRWRKVLRDLGENGTRSLLVVLAIALGVFAITGVSSAYSILSPNIDLNYQNTNPASATLWTNDVDDELVQSVRDLPAIADAEARRSVMGRILVGPDEWLTIWLFAIADFGDLRVSTFTPEEGRWPPARGEILIERAALELIKAQVGDTVTIKTPHGSRQEMPIAGSVHDPGQAPAWMEGWAYGYISLDTLAWLGESGSMDQLKIVVAGDQAAVPPGASQDRDQIVRVASQTKAWIEATGRPVVRIEVPPPGEHPHIGQMSSLMYLLEAMGLLALALSGVLVANMISALLAQQIRQIGVMKAVGASTRQIMGVYFGTVLILGTVALAMAMPLGLLAGRAYTVFATQMLNFELLSTRLPLWVYAFQAILGLLVPVLVAAYPVYKGSRVTVQQAVGDYGVGQGRYGSGALDRLLGRVGGLMRPLLLSIRNTFRRRGRLAFTLGTLVVGGAVFMATMNIRASIGNTLQLIYDSQRVDVTIRFVEPYPAERILKTINQVPGVAGVEIWDNANASVVYRDGTAGNRFRLVAAPETTDLLDLKPTEGRWLQPGDRNVLVVNQRLDNDEADIQVGDEVRLKVGGQEVSWRVVGIVREAMTPPTAYVNSESLRALGPEAGIKHEAMVVTSGRDAASQDAVALLLEQALESAGLNVALLLKTAHLRKAIEDHMLIILNFLMLMTFLIVAVGGLGLMTTMSINVLERRREIGVMRAIGASGHAVLRIVVAEGGLIGLLSWLIAPLLAQPLSILIGNRFASIMLETNLDFVFSPLGLGLWLGIVILFAGAASFQPAWNASRLAVRDVLAYE